MIAISPAGRACVARLRARRRNRGAALFLVVLVISMLAAMGVFASRAAGLTEAAAGFERSSMQTEAMMQHGMLLTAGEIGANPDVVVKFLRQDPNAGGNSSKCAAGKWFPAVVGYNFPCIPYDMSKTLSFVGTTVPETGQFRGVAPAVLAGGNPSNPASYDPGSLGQTPLSAFVSAELSDPGPYPRQLEGQNAGTVGPKFGYYMGTLGMVAQVSPLLSVGAPGVCQPTDALTGLVASRLVGRGYIVVGPVQVPN